MNAPDIKTALPGPNAKAIIDRDRKYVSPSYTRDYPFVIARGEGAVVEDVDGNRFLDCAAGIAVNSTGVSHPEVVKAIADQARSSSTCRGRTSTTSRRYASPRSWPPSCRSTGDVRTFFANSGTEATEAAIKLARYHTKRARHHRVSRRLPWPLARVAVADREQGRAAARVRPVHAGRLSRAVSGYLSRVERQMPPRRSRCRSSRISSSRTWFRPTKSRRSSSSRFRARAATWCRRRRSCRGCAS